MKSIFLTVLSLCILTICYSQGEKVDATLKLEDLQLTNAPGFSLLDASPSSIERPASTKAFAASVVNAINQNGGIPQNYAVEFTPFWFMRHPNMTALKYYGVNTKVKNNTFSQARLASISFAMINNQVDSANKSKSTKNMSLGMRTTLLKFYKASTLKKIKTENDNWVLALKNMAGKLGDNPTPGDIDQAAKGMHSPDSIKKYLSEKPIASLDIAGAANIGFDNESYSSNRLTRGGIWANINGSIPLNKTNQSYVNIYTITRWLRDQNNIDGDGKYISVDFYDVGTKLELELGALSFAYEYVRRATSQTDVQNSFKSVGLIKYKIKDGLYVTGGFGKNFSTLNNVISSIGINWGFTNGKEQINSN